MSLLTPTLDYTDRDFDAIRARLINLRKSVFPTWTDEQIADFGNLLTEMFAFTGDVLTKYQDNQARESRFTAARLRRSLLAFAKLLTYTPRGRSAATADETFTLAAIMTGSVTLPAGSRVLTAEVTSSIAYQLLEDLVFAAGETSKTATIENSTSREAVFAASGLADQELLLPAVDYLDASAEISDATVGPYDATLNPSGWKQVDTFLDSSATDPHFTTFVDESGRAHVRFGSGVSGRLPSGNITVAYRTGGGKAGRVEENKLTRVEGSFSDSFGAAASITVTNAAASSGGEDQESVEQIRQNAPASLTIQHRAVSRPDYEISALEVAGVARALHLTLNEGLGVGENEGRLFIVPVGAGEASSDLLDAVRARFAEDGETPKTNTYRLTVQSAVYLTIDLSSRVFIRKGFAATTVRANIEAALDALFAEQTEDGVKNEAIDFGFYFQDEDGEPTGTLAWSDVFNAIRDATGVLKVSDRNDGLLLNGANDDVPILVYEFPKLGTVTLINDATGDPL